MKDHDFVASCPWRADVTPGEMGKPAAGRESLSARLQGHQDIVTLLQKRSAEE